VSESVTVGTRCHSMWLKHRQRIRSRTDSTSTGQIWARESSSYWAHHHQVQVQVSTSFSGGVHSSLFKFKFTSRTCFAIELVAGFKFISSFYASCFYRIRLTSWFWVLLTFYVMFTAVFCAETSFLARLDSTKTIYYGHRTFYTRICLDRL